MKHFTEIVAFMNYLLDLLRTINTDIEKFIPFRPFDTKEHIIYIRMNRVISFINTKSLHR